MRKKPARTPNGGNDRKRLERVEREQKRTNQHLQRLETVHRDTNARLGRIEETLQVSSKLFELMHDRLEGLEDGQKAVIDRLDRLVRASTVERTRSTDRIARLERRLDAAERKLGSRG